MKTITIKEENIKLNLNLAINAAASAIVVLTQALDILDIENPAEYMSYLEQAEYCLKNGRLALREILD